MVTRDCLGHVPHRAAWATGLEQLLHSTVRLPPRDVQGGLRGAAVPPRTPPVTHPPPLQQRLNFTTIFKVQAEFPNSCGGNQNSCQVSRHRQALHPYGEVWLKLPLFWQVRVKSYTLSKLRGKSQRLAHFYSIFFTSRRGS